MDERHLLILDLDETLLFADESALDRAPDHEVPPYFIYRRPFLASFLEFVWAHFEVAVWTSSSPAYAKAVCAAIFPRPPSFVWASDRCTPKRNLESDSWSHAKHLTKLKRRGYDLRRVLVVDDSPEKHTRNYGNLVRVTPFLGDPQDQELTFLAAYLGLLSREPNVRTIEKRNWRKHITHPVPLADTAL